MNYKGYIGKVEYDEDAHIFSGEVVNTRTVITFQGSSVEELEREFKNSIDDYLEWCKEDHIEPEKPYSGSFNLRLGPELHQKAALKAKILGISLNTFVSNAVKEKIN